MDCKEEVADRDLKNCISFLKSQLRSGSNPTESINNFKLNSRELLTQKNISQLADLVFYLLDQNLVDLAFQISLFGEQFNPTTEARTLEMYALTARVAGHPDIALLFYERYLDQGGQIEKILIELSYCLMDSGDKDGAVELLKIHGRTNSLPRSLIGLAEIEKIDGNLEAALVFYFNALDLGLEDVPSDWVYEQIASLYLKMGRWSDVLIWIEKSLEVKETASAYLIKADILLKAYKVQDAKKYCMKAIEMSPDLPARRTLFQILRRINLDEASSCLAESLRISGEPVPCELLKDQGSLYFDRKDWHQSAKAFSEACSRLTLSYLLDKTSLGVSRKTIPSMNSANAEIALSDFAALCRKNRIPFFLSFGSALGVFREGRLLGHDKDIDIGILPEGDLRQLIDVVEQSDLFSVERQYDDMFDCDFANLTLFAPIRHVATGICIDVCQFFERNEKLYAGFHVANETEFLWEFSPFDIQDVRCLGGTYPLPSEMDQFLTSLYGNWEVPDSNYDTVVMAPNLTASSEIIRLNYCLIRYFEACLSGDWHRCLALAKVLAKQQAFDSWTTRAVDHFENLLVS